MGDECEKNHGQRPMHKEVFNAAFSDRIVLQFALASIGVSFRHEHLLLQIPSIDTGPFVFLIE